MAMCFLSDQVTGLVSLNLALPESVWHYSFPFLILAPFKKFSLEGQVTGLGSDGNVLS